ncbi:DUF6920 family protein [Piscinibacter sp.]|uniref:DUF6920 family protein n=1 Tax=Piscinibacter sp. TaxID=1903157 RepID=UPI002C845701|nr:DUF6544 family protein [Albitalea sp.]HUG25440.1 DUF6544 family protein [Albitalea sp.]
MAFGARLASSRAIERFFAEMAWYPTALLPSQGVRREAIDDRSANATIVDGRLTLTLVFRFNASGSRYFSCP